MSLPPTVSAPPLRRLLVPLLVVGLLAVAVAVLHRTFRGLSWAGVAGDVLTVGPGVVVAALVLTAVSYLAMTGYDAVALRCVGHPLPYRRYGTASFIATAFGNNLGASALVGAALRVRVYSSWQVPVSTITRVVGINAVTLALGAAVLAGGGVLHDPTGVAVALHLPVTAVLAVGALLVAAVLGYLAWTAAGRPSGRRRLRVDRPSPRLALVQVLLSTFEWLSMAAVLHVLLPAEGRVAFLPFAAAFAIAVVAGLVSNLPGGLGVFETTLVVLIGSTTSPAGLAAALVVYRLCYYVLPLLLAAALLVVHEARRASGAVAASRAVTASRSAAAVVPVSAGPRSPRWVPSVRTPAVLALSVAGAGVFMVVAGDLPGSATLDPSAVTTSLVGVAALLVAGGLHRRLRGAWIAALTLLGGVAALAATHGDLVLAAAAAVLALPLLRTRSAFHRGGCPVHRRTVLRPVLATVLVGTAVWWHELSGLGAAVDAPLLVASLSQDTPALDRLVMAAGTVGVLIGGRRAFSATAPAPRAADEQEMARVATIVARSGRCVSHLAFTGDKRFHFSPDGTAFLMYQVEGRSWVVMGDPVGDPDAFRGLVLSFLAEIDRHGGRPAFYNVLTDHVDLYRECGLSLAKLGEEAVVPLAGFTLAGKARMGLRNCRNKSQRLGLVVEFVAAADVAPLLSELREVSEVWLAHRNGREKRFSLGAFDEDYVCRFPLVVIRHEGRITAFATLWVGGDGREVQVDLMRRLPDGPRTVMTFLFVECILWAKDNGFATFNLGMAPLSGLRTDAAASPWDRLGHLLWTYGERFYNFKGLRTFKQGFDPDWRTCYVAAPGGLALPNVMTDVATLVGGGLRGVLRG
ncbi:bifunctional lysylphosphatidylglycerol flippase/synthetase MprF [Kineococcus rubinsiae]|uniref:bifunctional lysylphosphatidylglycerol flippase/synthetase MprF n=1 Tax=Kineococcus rubinsiae TaxID=2609562 RepID=UPI0014312DB4|nr:bifunctional lysylphosphatidylglycerol flippase/synthetase MprF [Kineococcus rubinsiae]NIZ90265.1 bifunctional lysylphosphatidylglycerol flippase/synthetase MprF [Kineococcus rubinsiae]